jgi:hypothetical protein
MHSARDAHSAEGLPPRNGICLAAALQRQRVAPLRPLPDEAVNLLIRIDERLLHSDASIGLVSGQSKRLNRSSATRELRLPSSRRDARQ